MEPTPLHHHLASLPLPVIVDSWYDGPMRTALGTRDGWGEVQGIARSGIHVDCWYPFTIRRAKRLIMPRRPIGLLCCASRMAACCRSRAF